MAALSGMWGVRPLSFIFYLLLVPEMGVPQNVPLFNVCVPKGPIYSHNEPKR